MKQNPTRLVASTAELLRAYDMEMALCNSKRTRIESIAQTRLASTHFLSQQYLSGQHIRKCCCWKNVVQAAEVRSRRPGFWACPRYRHLWCLTQSRLPPDFDLFSLCKMGWYALGCSLPASRLAFMKLLFDWP